jgi:predicted nucleic acid-binding Zn ribbon protein
MSDLEHVGNDLEQMLRRLGMPDPAAAERLVEEWATVAGEPWAGRSRPAGLKDGVLVVEVDDGSVATLLKYQERALLERLARHLGPGLATSVRIRVARRKKGL